MNKLLIRYSMPIAAGILAVSLLSGCGNPPDQTTSHLRDSAVAPADTGSRSPAGAAYVALTLPVLDALLHEGAFEQDLKSKLELTGEQIAQLKSVSRASVADLVEEDPGGYSGSTRAATQRYEAEIRSILGEGKAAALAQLVDQRYAGGDLQGLMPTGVNAVPTDTRIVVNIPACRMDVFKQGYLIKTYLIGIGYPEFPLPTGMRQAGTIVFNPSWTPPDEPWVKGRISPGRKVAAGSRDNPLGPVKIPIGSPSLIHGGKAASRLGGFASHGCVGLTDEQVKDFALVLAGLSGTALAPEDVRSYTKAKDQTKSLKLAQAVPVELRYETIVAEDGLLRIFRDVYERGTNTADGARRVLQAQGVSYDSLSVQEKAAIREALAEMDRDPLGRPISTGDVAGSDSALAASGRQRADSGILEGVAASKRAGARKGIVTGGIVGRREVAVPVSRLKGRGYPAPVHLNSGTGHVTASGR